MALIWLYLLGFAEFASGHYTEVEITLTVVIAVCSIFGILKYVQTGRIHNHRGRILLVSIGAGIQTAFMAASFRFFD